MKLFSFFFALNFVVCVASDGAGPERHYSLEDGTKIPFYAISFDEEGQILNENDAMHLIHAVADEFTDIYMFSHGWNNNANESRVAYDAWIHGYMGMRDHGRFPLPTPYRPVLVGIIWPSKWDLSWHAPWSFDVAKNISDSVKTDLVDDLASHLESQDKKTDFKKLGMKESLERNEFKRMFDLMEPLLMTPDDELHLDESPTPDDIADAFKCEAVDAERDVTMGKLPSTRGGFCINPILGFSFWQMRGRAAVVGKRGVHPLLMNILQSSAKESRVHVIGHSFGARVILSAVAAGANLPREIDSMFLMAPAVVHKVFDNSEEGIYRKVLSRTKPPILLTYSNKDVWNRSWFHWGLQIYSGERVEHDRSPFGSVPSDDPPHKYASLGGYPPVGLDDELTILEPKPVGMPISFPGTAVCAMKMHEVIDFHSDIRKPEVYWLLYSLVARGFPKTSPTQISHEL